MGGEAMPNLRAIFEQALSMPVEEREAFAIDSFPDDPASRVRLLSMLRACDQMDGFLEKPALFTNDFEQDVALPERIGAFEIEAVLGSGGMGVVYQAKQHEPSRRVALKVLAGIPGIETIKRFRREATFLAQLRHPNIAQVYEAGSHDDGLGGRPYFVMELVENALPLDEFAQRNNLSIEERLRMFIKVCHAVQFGHQRGVIHRDLKPSNVLVGSDGEPKVIDFGVAHATSDAEMSMVSVSTSPGQLMGTLRYMSPEQFGACEGGAIIVDTRTDVYSLGVVLYELLCGESPYDLSSVSAFDMPAIIRDQAVPRLSRHNPSFKGELETIVHKALEKLPERRYETVHELAEDVQRFLNSEPIAAKRDRAFYVLRKSLVRYRVAVLVSVGFVVLSTASAVTFAVLYDRAEEARAEAEERNRELRQENYFALITLADDAIQRNAVQEARTLLEQCPDDLREWEWRFLWNSLNDASFTMELPNNLHPADLSKDRRTVLAVDRRPGRASVALVDRVSNTETWRHDFGDHIADFARFSPDEKYFAMPVRFQNVFVFDADKRELLFTIAGHHKMWFTPDSSRVIAVASGGSCQIWDLATAQLVRQLHCPTGIYAGAISSDGNLLAIGTHGGSDGATAAILDIDSGVEVWRQTGNHIGHITGLTFTKDNATLYTAEVHRVAQWNVLRGEVENVIVNTGYVGGDLALSADERTLVLPYDEGIVLCDVESGQTRRVLRGQEFSWIVKFMDESTLMSCGRSSLCFWDLDKPTATRAIDGHPQWVDSIAFSNDGKWLATTGEEGELHLRDAGLGGPERTIGTVLSKAEKRLPRWSSVAFSPDSSMLAHCGEDRVVRVWQIPSLELIREIRLPADVKWWSGNRCSMVWASQRRSTDDASRAFLFVGAGRDILLVSIESGEVEARLQSPQEGRWGSVHSLAMRDDGTMLAMGDESGRVSLWLIGGDKDEQSTLQDELRLLSTWRADEATGDRSENGLPITSLEFARDGRWLISTGTDQRVRVWDVESGECVHVLRGHDSNVYEARVLPGGRRLVSTGGAYACIWDMETGRMVLKLRQGSVKMAIHPHSESIVTQDAQNIRNLRIFTPGMPPETRTDRAHAAS